MKQFLNNLRPVLPILFLWLATLVTVAWLSIRYLDFSPTFPYYTDLSNHYDRLVATLAHFDGIHYLRQIVKGYDDTGSQAFFPLYPLLVRLLTFGIFDPLVVGVVINLLSLITSLGIVALSLKRAQFRHFVILFLTFPASFFLLTLYTESVFVLLVVLFFYLLSRRSYGLAAVVAGLASGTRLAGGLLALSLALELYKERGSLAKSLLLLLISTSGLWLYMIYLYFGFGDPLMFVHVQSMFANGRASDKIVLLPQVLYRYLKILLTVPFGSVLYLRSVWELATFGLSVLTLYVYRAKFSLATLVFCVSAMILPTLSGTLSSYPRYLLPLTPLFIVVASSLPQRAFYLVVSLQYAILIAGVALFVQGIFVA